MWWGWVARSKWPILLPARPLEKPETPFVRTSIHRLCEAKVWVQWWASGIMVGAFKGATNFSQSRYDPSMDIERKRELWDHLENEPERAYLAFESYRNLPSGERTLIEAYRGHVGNPGAAKPSDTWSRWSREFAWRERAAAYDAHIDRLREKSMEKVIQREAEEQARQVERMRGRFNELMTIAYCETMEYLESEDFVQQMRPQDVINIMKLYFEVTQKMGDTNTQSTDSVVDWSEDEPPHCCMV